MRTRLHDFDYDCPLSILIGENGSGKSQALADIAEAYISKNRTVIAIANCPFDKFRDKGKRYFFMGGRYGQTFLSIALQRVIASIKEPSDTRFLIGTVLERLGYQPRMGICQENAKARIDWFDLSSSQSSESLSRYSDEGAWTLNLYKDELRNWPAIFLHKGNEQFPMEQASSGEIQLITTLAFIASHIDKDAAILIDEPENSLHPRWQRDYIKRLFDLFHYHRPRVVIATHSPVMVTTAPHAEMPWQAYAVKDNALRPLDCGDEGMEQVLWDVFRMLTPRSAFLSHHMTTLLHRRQQGMLTEQLFHREFDELEAAAAHDGKQLQLIRKARMLVS